jgi:tetratricopeptide (TPR) repeat protein
VAAFGEAGRLDPSCAMCWWGVALALGPNINAPMGPQAARRAYAALEQARRLAPGASERERAYIEALATRYRAEPPEERAPLDRAYARAMGALYRADPADDDAAVLYAESLMDLHPWDYWTDDAQPREGTLELVSVFETVLARSPHHVGANHYYIHAVEEFFPERGVPAAERLAGLAPEAGHLVHMPSHIFWRVGRYGDALDINDRAVAADEQFFAWCRPGVFYRAAYYNHNLHFLWAAAAAQGQSAVSLATSRQLAAAATPQVDEFPFAEEFLSIPTLSLARFGRFDGLLAEPRPEARRPYLTGIWHYARGLARVRSGAADLAATELAALREAAAAPPARDLVLAGGMARAADLLEIGAAHLEGELAAARGDTGAAVASLERAVALQDRIPYIEPPPWYFPTRQALGAVLLDAGRAADAEAVYRRDLEQHPRNGWSLYGLWQSLLAQGRGPEAAWAERGFRAAWAQADVELTSSRF